MSPEWYLTHADECESMARNAITDDERLTLLGMAKEFRVLAETAKRDAIAGREPRE